jgi:phospholipid/cholesterol/gamma-HCH transport system permease protein
MPDRGTRRPRKGGTTLAEPGEGSGTPPMQTGGDQALTRAEMARLLGTPSGRPDPAVGVLPPPKRSPAGDGKVMSTVRETGNMFATAFEALRQAPLKGVPVTEFFDQCWFLARVTTLPLILLSIPFGMVIALEVGSLLQQIGAQSQLGAAMVLAVVREQAPVATALLIAGAGGSAMCADLGSRRIRDEISAMEVMGVNPLHRLVLPRLLAATVVAVLLDAVVSVAGIAGGLWFGTHAIHITASSFFATFSELSQLADLVIALVKAALFGFIAAMVACYKGLYCKSGPKGVGDAVNQAVVITFILSFFVNFLLTVFYFNFIPQKGI